MNQLINHLNAGVAEQNREVALENCLKTWDDSLDLETILQGILARFKAIGMPIEGGIRANRRGLDHIQIESPQGPFIWVSKYQSSRYVGTGYAFDAEGGKVVVLMTTPTDVKVFHNHELETMARWLLENFHE